MKAIMTTKKILSSPSTVWKVLTNLREFSEWNPLITRASGSLVMGERLNIIVSDGKGGNTEFTPRVLACHPEQELRWRGAFYSENLLSGEHYFHLSPTAEGHTDLVHGEIFGGCLAPLVSYFMGADYIAQFEAMNQSLADRCLSLEAKPSLSATLLNHGLYKRPEVPISTTDSERASGCRQSMM